MASRLTYANVTATLALFVALGGSSYAAVKLTGKDIADGTLTTKDVKNKSLLKRDFKAGQLPAGAPGTPGTKGDPGAQGIQGVQGIQGEQGLQGEQGEAGSARGYALIGSFGELYDEPDRKNVDRSTQLTVGGVPAAGYYCLHTTFIPHNAVATLRPESSPGEISAVVYSNLEGIHCNGAGDPGYNIVVRTWDSEGVAQSRQFYIAIN